jgi:hypothetical protein
MKSLETLMVGSKMIIQALDQLWTIHTKESLMQRSKYMSVSLRSHQTTNQNINVQRGGGLVNGVEIIFYR